MVYQHGVHPLQFRLTLRQLRADFMGHLALFEFLADHPELRGRDLLIQDPSDLSQILVKLPFVQVHI